MNDYKKKEEKIKYVKKEKRVWKGGREKKA